MLKRIFATAGLAMAGSALGAPVDLSSWVSDDHTITAAATSGSNWVVQGAGNDSVFQNVNGRPTVFYDFTALSQGTALGGEITVETTSDDDFVGFVLGYQAGEINTATGTDFYLVDWKQGTQPFGAFGTAQEGLAISHVTAPSGHGLWGRDSSNTPGGVSEIARATNLGATGWNDNQTYTFDIEYTDQVIRVFVDGALELDVTAADFGLSAFDNGSFGFYNYSQSNVRYAGIEQVVLPPDPGPGPGPAPVPEPGTMALTALALAGLGARRKLAK